MSLIELKQYIIDNCKHLSNESKKKINDIWQLAISEIEDGENEEHECYLALNDIKEILSKELKL